MEEELKIILSTVGAAYAVHTKLAASTIWARAAKDARFLDRIESGQGFTVKTYDRAMQWFSDNWPEDAEWPAGVERPFRSEETTETEVSGEAA